MVPEQASQGFPRAVGQTSQDDGVGPGTGLPGASRGCRTDHVNMKGLRIRLQGFISLCVALT